MESANIVKIIQNHRKIKESANMTFVNQIRLKQLRDIVKIVQKEKYKTNLISLNVLMIQTMYLKRKRIKNRRINPKKNLTKKLQKNLQMKKQKMSRKMIKLILQ